MKQQTADRKHKREDVLCALGLFGVTAGLLALRCGAAVWPYLH